MARPFISYCKNTTSAGWLVFAAGLLLWGCAPPQETSSPSNKIYEPMAIFAALDGKTMRGEGTAPDGSPIVDIAKWEMILGGRAFQWTHRLEDGSYGGRTIFFYDEAAQEYIFHYFTTAGFHTTGGVTPTETGFIVIEKVLGHPKFVEIYSEIIIDKDEVRIASRHKDKDGVLTEGEVTVFRESDYQGPLFGDGSS